MRRTMRLHHHFHPFRLGRSDRQVRGPRFYVGRAERARREVFVVDGGVRRLDHPGPLEWGTAGAAGRRLADGVLRDAIGHRPSDRLVASFADEIVARLHGDGFVLAAESVRRWVEAP